MIAFVN